jgi:protein-L-isoaspartate(D-aspartate) O-methyltransferase
MDPSTDPHSPEHGWCQVSLWCQDWRAAEQMAVHHLEPQLAQAQHGGLLAGWWFLRKDACWRVRYQPRPGRDEAARAAVGTVLLELVANDVIVRWAATRYEPEIHAFGGADGIDIAHALFDADSHHILEHLRRFGGRNRSELGVLLACALMRGAGQDWYEQGDIFAQVAAHRPGKRPPTDTETDGVGRLLAARSTSISIGWAATWPAAFQDAGAALAALAHEGRLTRGLRAVLAHHVLFAWNRAGISAHRQALLASAAAGAVFHRDLRIETDATTRRAPAWDHAARVTEVTATDTTREHEAARLRAGLVDYIRGRGTFRTPAVEAAFTRVPRHLFLPEVDLRTAYAPQVVVTKLAPDGSAISSASHPNMVASMLEQLEVSPGHRVLEIGAATGINAALLAELVDPTGAVTTIEIDADLAEGARAALAVAGYGHVEVVCSDGAFGHPDRAPYDRIIVTAGAWDIPAAWWRQLAPAGRMVVPLRLHDSGLTRSIAFDRSAPDRMVSVSATVCGFVPLRGASDSTGHSVQMADDITLALGSETTGDGLSQALTHSPHRVWTGITIGHADPVEHLDLWLATTADHFARLITGTRARQSGPVTPALRWAGATLHDDAGTLAYLALRPAGDQAEELGVVAHGPEAAAFTAHTVELLHRWSKERPTQPSITAHPASTPAETLPNGTRIHKPDTTLTITW